MRPPERCTLYELVCEQAERYGERPAVFYGKGVASYRELAERAGRVAAALRARDFGRPVFDNVRPSS